MGTSAPAHYLTCDGTEYNIADYPDLVKHLIDNYGVANYFGGDGETTFAVPKYSYMYESIIPVMSGYSQNGFVASASSEYSTLYPAWKAFTKSANSAEDSWATLDGQTTGWIQIKCPVPVSVNMFSVTARYNQIGSHVITYPIDFSLYGSDDGSTWTELKVVTNEPSWSMGENRYYDVPNSPQYIYYRLAVTKSSNTTYMDIANFDLYHSTDMRCIKYEPTYFMKNVYDVHDIYSTEEKVVGRYIDGKPVYKCTLKTKLPVCASAGTEAVSYYKYDADIDWIVDLDVIYKSTTGVIWKSYVTANNLRCGVFWNPAISSFQISNTTPGWSNGDAIITTLYTKTTDTPYSDTMSLDIQYTDEEVAAAVADVLK